MPTLFTRIIEGEIPGVFVWRDDQCVVFLSINPMHTGHTLVVPRAEVDHWIDLDPDLAAHLFQVAQTIGQAQMAALRRPAHRRDDRRRRGAARAPPRRAVRLGVGALVRPRRSQSARGLARRRGGEDPRRVARPARAAARSTSASSAWAATTSGSRATPRSCGTASPRWPRTRRTRRSSSSGARATSSSTSTAVATSTPSRRCGSTPSATTCPSSTTRVRDQLDRGAHSTMLGNGNRVVVELAEALGAGGAGRRPALPVRVRRRRRGRAGAEDRVPVLGEPGASPDARSSSPSAARTTATRSARSRSVTAGSAPTLFDPLRFPVLRAPRFTDPECFDTACAMVAAARLRARGGDRRAARPGRGRHAARRSRRPRARSAPRAASTTCC